MRQYPIISTDLSYTQANPLRNTNKLSTSLPFWMSCKTWVLGLRSVKVLCHSLQKESFVIQVAQLNSNCMITFCFAKFPCSFKTSDIFLFSSSVDVQWLQATAVHCRGSCISVKAEVMPVWYRYFTNTMWCEKDYINVSMTATFKYHSLKLPW